MMERILKSFTIFTLFQVLLYSRLDSLMVIMMLTTVPKAWLFNKNTTLIHKSDLIKKSAIITLLVLLSFFTQAQPNLDSLWGVWNDETKPDSCRTLAMHKISWDGYIFSQPDSAYYFAQMLYDFAEKKGIKKEMARALNTQGVSFYIRGDYVMAMHYYKGSLEITEEIADKRRMASIMNNMGLIYSRKGRKENLCGFELITQIKKLII